MGRWFMHYFAQSKTVKIFVHDKRKHAFRIPDCVHVCRTIRTCVEEADLVIICVPIGSIVSVVQECLTYMKEGAAILEISSIKKQIYSVLRVQERMLHACASIQCLDQQPKKRGSSKICLFRSGIGPKSCVTSIQFFLDRKSKLSLTLIFMISTWLWFLASHITLTLF